MISAKTSQKRRRSVCERPIREDRPLQLPAQRPAQGDLISDSHQRWPAVCQFPFEPFCHPKRFGNCEERAAVKDAPLLRAIERGTKIRGTAHVWICTTLTDRRDLLRQLAPTRCDRIAERGAHGEGTFPGRGEGALHRDQREEGTPFQALERALVIRRSRCSHLAPMGGGSAATRSADQHREVTRGAGRSFRAADPPPATPAQPSPPRRSDLGGHSPPPTHSEEREAR